MPGSLPIRFSYGTLKLVSAASDIKDPAFQKTIVNQLRIISDQKMNSPFSGLANSMKEELKDISITPIQPVKESLSELLNRVSDEDGV